MVPPRPSTSLSTTSGATLSQSDLEVNSYTVHHTAFHSQSITVSIGAASAASFCRTIDGFVACHSLGE